MLSALAVTLALAARPITVHMLHTDATPLALHCVQPDESVSDENARRSAVLFIHGASFPTRLAAGFEFAPGDSWLHHAARKNHLACGLDFSGFGASAAPDALLHPPADAPPAVTSADAVEQIAAAVAYLRETNASRIHLVAHSWGTVPAARFGAEHPDALASLTLFGPVVPTGEAPPVDNPPAWYPLAATARYEQLKYEKVLPANVDLLEPAVHERWAGEFSAAARAEITDAAGTLRIPAGPVADIGRVRSGALPFDPARVRAPVMIVYGNHDTVVNHDTVKPFLDGFRKSPLKWQLQLDDGTHVMHLERNRRSLYEAVSAFIATVDAG